VWPVRAADGADARVQWRRAMTAFADFQRLSERLQTLPESVAYIVLDHGTPATGHIDAHDGRGRRYIQCSPAVLDSVRYVRAGEESPSMFGIPVYRRESLPDGWPNR
jgi:hypothetical protein